MPSSRWASAANISISVGCDPNLATRRLDLINAITTANANSGSATISLASSCVYTLIAANNNQNGLPIIANTIVINGNNATITRDTSKPDFRILYVSNVGAT